MIDVAIIGGGAAGFFTAINIKKRHPGLNVRIFEKSKTVLGKVKVSGGGRCNVTHACFDHEQLTRFYPRGRKELLSVFRRFGPEQTIEWFNKERIALKTENDGRMFPVTDDSQTIINCFLGLCSHLQVGVSTNHSVDAIAKRGSWFELGINGSLVHAKKVVIATGSSEHFWNLVSKLGHSIVRPVPSLFTFNIKHPLLHDLMGLSVNPASVKLLADKSKIKEAGLKADDIEQSGPLLITHWGLSGPAILKLSSVAARLLNGLNYEFNISVSFSSMNSEETRLVIQACRQENSRKQAVNTPMFNIPSRLWMRLIELSFDKPDMNWSDVSKKELMKLAENLSNFVLPVKGKSTFKEEFVTAGGVELKEIDFSDMQSKIVPGLYMAGEVLNIDALTGGFNFQAAWSEGWVISENI